MEKAVHTSFSITDNKKNSGNKYCDRNADTHKWKIVIDVEICSV